MQEKSRRQTELPKPKKQGRPIRRISQDDMDIDILMRRHSNEREAVLKKHAKCDLDLDDHKKKKKESTSRISRVSSRRSSNEKKKSSSSLSPSRKTSVDRKEGGEREARKSSLEPDGKPSKPENKSNRRPNRRPSVDDSAIYEFKKQSKRASHDSDSKPKAKDDMDITSSQKPEKTKPPLERRRSAEKSEIKKHSSDGNEPKKPGRRSRRPSIDDLAVSEYEKLNRRKSNETNDSKKSKCDMDLDTKKSSVDHHKKKGDKGKSTNANDKSKKSNLEKFEEMLSSSLHSSSKDDDEESGEEEKEKGGKGSSTKRLSRGSADLSSRPKQRSLDEISSSGDDKKSKRSSMNQTNAAKDPEEQEVEEKKELIFNFVLDSKKQEVEDQGHVAKVEPPMSKDKSHRSSNARESNRSLKHKNDDDVEQPPVSRRRRHTDKIKRRSSIIGRNMIDRSKSVKIPKRNKSGSRAMRRRSSSEGDILADIEDLDEDNLDDERPSVPRHESRGGRRHTDRIKRRSSIIGRNMIERSKSVKIPKRSKSGSLPKRSRSDFRPTRRRSSSSLSEGDMEAIAKLGLEDIDELDEERSSVRHDESRGGGGRHSNAKKKEKTKRRSSLTMGSLGRSSQNKSRSSRRHQKKKEPSTKRRMASPDTSNRSHQGLSSYDEESGEHRKTEADESTSELDSYLEQKNSRSVDNSTVRSSSRSRKSTGNSSRGESRTRYKRTAWQRFKWKCMCCITMIIFIAVAAVVALIVLKAMNKSVDFNVTWDVNVMDEKPKNGTDAPTSLSAGVLGAKPPSVSPTIAPSLPVNSAAPTPSPLANVAIAIIVQLDAKPEETGFSLMSADNSTTYISRPIGSLSGQQDEVVMEVISIPEKTELAFTIEDASGDGICCTHGKGYYRVFAGTGDQKIKMVSGEQSAKYLFTVGLQQPALQIGGVDPNENCKPCMDGKDCGRCAWCNAEEGFLPDTIYTYQCHSELKSIPKKCFIGEKRYQLHNQYVAAMAGCGNGFEAHPQIQTSPDVTVCVEEAKCVKTFAFMEPDCDDELSGSLLVKETCQDKIGGIPFGYGWGLNAPREQECPSSGKFAAEISPRCCVDGVAFCSTLDLNDNAKDEQITSMQENTVPTPMPAADNTYTPTESNAPTWDGYPISVLIQLDDFPRETGFTITSVDKEVTYLERRQGYYKQKSQLAVEKVQIPEGTEAILTLTDEQGDGICCENGNGYYQIYSDQGSLILDEAGTFAANTSNTFFVGDPKTLPPTVSTSPTVSVAPTFDQFPITIAVQLDQWSAETGFSIQSTDGSLTYFDWPAGSFSGQPSSLVVKTVLLPRDIEANLRVTDTGGDGFCCLYGDGYIKIFAGESADDESQILAFEDGDFETDLSIAFNAGPAPSRAPTTTSIPTVSHTSAVSIGPSSSGQPTANSTMQITVVLQLDKYSAETGWSIDLSDGLTNFAARPSGYYEENKSQKIIETVSLPEGLEYQFKITDFMGDGTCCWAGNGWYSLYEGTDIEDLSTQVFYGDGDFGRERVHTFVVGKPKTASPTRSRVPSEMPSDWPSLAPSHSSSPSITKYALEVTIKLDDNSSQTGWYIASDDGVVIIDRPAGWYNGNDTLTVIETVKLEAGEYIFSLLDTNGDGFCCDQGFGYYSLYFNGDLLIFREGRFEYSHNETFSIYPNSNKTLSTTKSAQMLRGSDPSSYSPNRQRKHEDKDT